MHVGPHSLTHLRCKAVLPGKTNMWFHCIEIFEIQILLEEHSHAGASPPGCTVLPAEYSVPIALLTHSQRV